MPSNNPMIKFVLSRQSHLLTLMNASAYIDVLSKYLRRINPLIQKISACSRLEICSSALSFSGVLWG